MVKQDRTVRWMAAALFVAWAAPAAAQSGSPINVSGGYASLRDYDGEVTFPRGWFASMAATIAGPIDGVVEGSGSYKSMGGLDVHVAVRIHTIMAGPRVQWRGGRLSPYAQMLFGVARIGSTFTLPEQKMSAAQHYFAMAPGGGVDVQVAERVAVRAGANLRLVRSETYTPTGSEPFNFRQLQLIAGIVVR